MNLKEAIQILRNADYLVEAASESDTYRAAKHVFAELEQKEPERVQKFIEKLKSAGIKETWTRFYFKRSLHHLQLENSEALYYLPGILKLYLIEHVNLTDIKKFIPRLEMYAKAGKKMLIGDITITKIDRYLNLYVALRTKNNQYMEFENKGIISLEQLNDFLKDYQNTEESDKNSKNTDMTKPLGNKTDYKIVKLETYKDTKPFHKYVEDYKWCYFAGSEIFDMYAKRADGNINMYLALKPGFENMTPNDPGFKDSMIAIDVGLSSKTGKPFLVASTSRTNHYNPDGSWNEDQQKTGDHCYNEKELSEVLGCPYYIACPPPKIPIDPDRAAF